MRNMKCPGRIVNVNGKRIHTYTIANSSPQYPNTLVFLSGGGTPCPIYDFKPLWNLLADKYNMVIVERPGYGWSEVTKAPRDIDTILSETRGALKLAGLEPPFVPVPHSMSGLEAIYWAQKYPDEVAAIIGLDMAVPEAYTVVKSLSGLDKVLIKIIRGLHINKLIAKRMVKSHPVVKNKLLNDEEIAAALHITQKQLFSKSVLDEGDYVHNNALIVNSVSCPSIPVLCFMADGRETKLPECRRMTRDFFSANNQAHFIELSCGHYVHSEAPEQIMEEISSFLN